jgi:hypothetical protein
MSQRLIDRIVADEPAVPFQADNSFTHSYFAFLQYFRDLPLIDRHHVIISANFTYGWMPTMLTFRSTQFEQAATILNHVKHGTEIHDNDLVFLVYMINNSLVGVSKLLHFIAPNRYAIWDSRVARYLYPNLSYYLLQQPATYHTYLQTCYDLIEQPEFQPVYYSINQKMGQPVSPLRAVEVVMYTGGAKQKPFTTETT